MTATIDLDGCRIDLDHGRLVAAGRDVPLTALETALLRYLAARPGLPVDRDELLTRVWGYAPGVCSRAPDATLRRLRRKLGEPAGAPRLLVWDRWRGLALVTPGP